MLILSAYTFTIIDHEIVIYMEMKIYQSLVSLSTSSIACFFGVVTLCRCADDFDCASLIVEICHQQPHTNQQYTTMKAPVLCSVNCTACLEVVNVSIDPGSSVIPGMDGAVFSGKCLNAMCSKFNSILYACSYCVPASVNNPKARKHPGLTTSWKACVSHTKSPFHQNAMQAHNNKEIHSPNVSVNDGFPFDQDEEVSVHDEFINDSITNDPTESPDLPPSKEMLSKLGFDPDSKSPEFFSFEQQYPGCGAAYLTAKAFQLPVEEIKEDEARFSLVISSLLVQLTGKQRLLFAECMLQAANWKDPELSIFNRTRVPTSEDDFQHLYLSGRNAVLPNLPHPVPKKTADGSHAYVSFKDVLANELAKGTPFDHFRFESTVVFSAGNFTNDESSPTISNTPSAHSLFMELKEEEEEGLVYLYLWIREWRDDFDPNGTKQARNQVWMNTFTCCPPPNESKGRNTYFMAISAKGEDHSHVETFFENEMKSLSEEGSLFYHGGKRKVIKVKAGRLSVCVDRPERSSMFQVGDHNGTFSSYWGYTCSVDGTCNENHLPSCQHCRKTLLQKHILRSTTAALPSGEGRAPDLLSPVDVAEASQSGEGLASQVLHPTSETCPHNKCCRWNVLDSSFLSKAPAGYPTSHDTRENAPRPPRGREIFVPDVCNFARNDHDGSNKRQCTPQTMVNKTMLPAIRLSVSWLEEALRFALHNVKTQPPNARGNKRFWTKANLTAYLRSCGVTTRLVDTVYQAAKSNDDCVKPPPTWCNRLALDRCHYAPMHMLFLGHVKSGFEMASKWMTHYEVNATFGRQANIYLSAIQGLRASRFFPAHPLSTSSWGTGAWVSENYLFWARAMKFFFLLPALHRPRLFEKYPTYQKDLRMLLRFVSATQSCITSLMSSNRNVTNLDSIIHIYLDTMVELDRFFMQSTGNNEQPGSQSSLAIRGRKKKMPNFVKANSLGILSAAEIHRKQGPAVLHWEGTWSGERKIQPVRPLLSVKRTNSDWQLISLRRLHQHETIEWLLSSMEGSKPSRNRDMDGVLKIFASFNDVEDAVDKCVPMIGVLSGDDNVWIPYRPKGRQGTTRSSLDIVQIIFEDTQGENLLGMCWFAPITLAGEHTSHSFPSVIELQKTFAKEFVLILPRMQDNGNQYKFSNNYYCVGHTWTERNSIGQFVPSQISADIFVDWVHTETEEATNGESAETNDGETVPNT